MQPIIMSRRNLVTLIVCFLLWSFFSTARADTPALSLSQLVERALCGLSSLFKPLVHIEGSERAPATPAAGGSIQASIQASMQASSQTSGAEHDAAHPSFMPFSILSGE